MTRFFTRSTAIAVTTIILLLLLNGCNTDKPPLRIATNPWPGYELLHLAESLGYFKEEGVNVQLVDFMSLGDSSRAFARGQVDAWGATVVELLLNRAQSNRNPQAFMVTNVSLGADMILSRASIATVKELKGKRVAVEPGTVDVVLLHHALQSAGLTLDDVKLVPIPQSDMHKTITADLVDAVCTYPPVSELILRDKSFVKLFDSSQIKNTIIDVLAADADSLNQRTQDYAKMARAFERARQYMNSHPEQAYAIMAKREGLSVEQFSNAIQGIHIADQQEQRQYFEDNGLLPQAIKSTEQALMAAKLLYQRQKSNLPPISYVVSKSPALL